MIMSTLYINGAVMSLGCTPLFSFKRERFYLGHQATIWKLYSLFQSLCVNTWRLKTQDLHVHISFPFQGTARCLEARSIVWSRSSARRRWIHVLILCTAPTKSYNVCHSCKQQTPLYCTKHSVFWCNCSSAFSFVLQTLPALWAPRQGKDAGVG